jgi:hypothetical protein
MLVDGPRRSIPLEITREGDGLETHWWLYWLPIANVNRSFLASHEAGLPDVAGEIQDWKRDQFMADTKASTLTAQRRDVKVGPAVLLCCAGAVVLVAAFAGHVMSTELLVRNQKWGAGIFALLGLMTTAIALGIAAVVWRGREEPRLGGYRKNTARFVLIFAALIALHCVLAFVTWRPGSGSFIDTFTFQQDACKNLLHGLDPYGATQGNL